MFIPLCLCHRDYLLLRKVTDRHIRVENSAAHTALQSVNISITRTVSSPAEFSRAAAHSLAGLKRFNQARCLLALDAFSALLEKAKQSKKKTRNHKGYLNYPNTIGISNMTLKTDG